MQTWSQYHGRSRVSEGSIVAAESPECIVFGADLSVSRLVEATEDG